jgi:hypothetical protein
MRCSRFTASTSAHPLQFEYPTRRGSPHAHRRILFSVPRFVRCCFLRTSAHSVQLRLPGRAGFGLVALHPFEEQQLHNPAARLAARCSLVSDMR